MAVNEAFDFSRFFGGNMGFGMPGIVTPTLDIDDLDKKIKDLKAVEGWLSMNLSMLQMSIQGLEVQRNTLTSLKAMGEAFNQSMSDVGKAAKENANARAAATEAPNVSADADQTTTTAGLWPWDFAAQAMASLQQQMQDPTNIGGKSPATDEQVGGTENTDPPAKPTRARKTKPDSV
jgi:hypothetical protein